MALLWHGCTAEAMASIHGVHRFRGRVVWHIPLASIHGYYHSNVMLSGWIYSLNFALSVFPFVLLMNWLYLRTGRNICMAAIFHITAGAFNEVFQTHPDSKVIQTGLLMLLTCVLLWRERNCSFRNPQPENQVVS
jgi:hypothetical protein